MQISGQIRIIEYIICAKNQGDGIKGALVVGLRNPNIRDTGAEGGVEKILKQA